MTEQPPQNNPEPIPTPEKLQIDDLSNFQFHAAYLKENKISPEAFYRNVARYRGDVLSERRRDRFTVQTQRKKDWRMKSQKQERIRRHRK
jgi:hypothetical protein